MASAYDKNVLLQIGISYYHLIVIRHSNWSWTVNLMWHTFPQNSATSKVKDRMSYSTLCLKKAIHLTFDHNYGRCGPTFEILSLTDSQGNSLLELTQFIWWMQTLRHVADNFKTKSTNSYCESAVRLLASTSNIATNYSVSVCVCACVYHHQTLIDYCNLLHSITTSV